jgi:hypothetical protein
VLPPRHTARAASPRERSRPELVRGLRAHAGVRTAALAAAAAVLLLPTVAAAGRPGMIPPMRIDIGPSISHEETEPAFQVVAGIHWASVYPNHKANIDIGVGIISASHFSDEAEDGTVSERVISHDEPMSLIGGYVEVAARTAGGRWWRSWVGTRVESGQASLDGRDHGFVGVATRVSTEAFVAGADSSSSGVVLGVFAIGLYGEVAVRTIDDVGNDLGASVGLSMRLPLIVAH